MIAESFADSNGVRIHFVDSAPGGSEGVPILFIPGALGTAEQYRAEMDFLAPRRCVALSLRGRGQSAAPQAGYTLPDHVADVEAVIAAAGLDRFALMGYSAGVPIAIEVAARQPERVAGLLIGDYPARARPFTHEWAASVRQERGDPVSPHLIDGLVREWEDIDLWGLLPLIGCPALILRGGLPGSLLSADEAARYLRGLKAALVAVFEESGHDLASPAPDRYLNTLRIFLAQLDMLEGNG